MLPFFLRVVFKISGDSTTSIVREQRNRNGRLWSFQFDRSELVTLRLEKTVYEVCNKPPVEMLNGGNEEDVLVLQATTLDQPKYLVIDDCVWNQSFYYVSALLRDAKEDHVSVEDYLEYDESTTLPSCSGVSRER